MSEADEGRLSDEQRRANDRRALIASLAQLRELEGAINDAEEWIAVIEDEHLTKQRERQAEAETLRAVIRDLAVRLRVPGRQYAEIPGMGRVQLRNVEDSVKVIDPEAAIAWAREHERFELIRRPEPAPPTKDALETNAYKAEAVKALKDGELLPGVERVPGGTALQGITWHERGKSQ